jgi:hypothetical protein
MMGEAAFILLKAGRREPESAKQAEIRLATLLKILPIVRCRGEKVRRKRQQGHAVVVAAGISARYG